jgi:hypothetical protein
MNVERRSARRTKTNPSNRHLFMAFASTRDSGHMYMIESLFDTVYFQYVKKPRKW